jgi:hypothetical protein
MNILNLSGRVLTVKDSKGKSHIFMSHANFDSVYVEETSVHTEHDEFPIHSFQPKFRIPSIHLPPEIPGKKIILPLEVIYFDEFKNRNDLLYAIKLTGQEDSILVKPEKTL